MTLLEKKCKKIFNWSDKEVEAILLFNKDTIDKNFLYLTGFYYGVFENCGILIDRECKAKLLTTALEEEIVCEYFKGHDIYVYKNEKERIETIKRVLKGYKKVGIPFIGINHSAFLWFKDNFPDIIWIDISKAIRMARMIKFDDELNNIKRACKIVSELVDEIPELFQRDITELELAAEIEYRMKKKGAQGESFNTIVAFGKNSSKPHYTGGNVKLDNKKLVLIDFGAVYNGYVSDITRTFLINDVSRELIDMYNIVKRVQQMAIDMIKAGVNSKYVEDEIRKYIDGFENFKGRFIHSLGHSIGREVHDDGYPGEDWEYLFEEGMTLTVEPGIYLPEKYGVRIEDDIYVKNDESEILTTASKELIIHAIK